MKKYDSYRDTGFDWIGKIPEHWDVIKTYIITENLDGEREPLNSTERSEMSGDIPYWGSNGVVDYVNDYIFDEEIVLVGEDGSPFFDRLKPVSFYINEKVWVNNHIHILKPKEKILPKYLVYSFNCVDYKKFITGSTRDKLTQTDLNTIPHTVPPVSEQKEMVDYLDEKISKVDSFIQSKQNKISLLKEKKVSLINRVVTKGLNSNAEMKESGIRWIGEIPNHWDSSKLGFYTTKIGSGSTPRGGSEVYVDSGIPFIRSQNVHFSGLKLGDVSFIPPEIHESMKNSTVFKNDVLLNITGGSIGRCCVADIEEEMNVNQHVSILRTKETLNPYFLNYILSSGVGQSQVDFNISGGNRDGLTINGMSNIRITIPPLLEQNKIVDYLDSETKKINSLIRKENKIT